MEEELKYTNEVHELTYEPQKLKTNPNIEYYRYVSELEWKQLKTEFKEKKEEFTGQKTWVYFTDQKFSTVEETRQKLALTYDPYYRVVFKVKTEGVCEGRIVDKIYSCLFEPINSTNAGNPPWHNTIQEPGGGNEFVCEVPLSIDVNSEEVQPLTYISYNTPRFLSELKGVLAREDEGNTREVISKIVDINDLIVANWDNISQLNLSDVYKRDFWTLNYFNYIKANSKNGKGEKIVDFVKKRLKKDSLSEYDIYMSAVNLHREIMNMYPLEQ